MRRILIGLLLLLLAIPLLHIGWNWVRDPVLTGRLLTLNQGPEATIMPGAPLVIGKRDRSQSLIDSNAFDAAIAYGAETDSHALIVYRAGAIELEHYYSDYEASTITPTQSMHKSVLALLTGIAISEGYIFSVDSPASLWIHEWRDDERHNITIRHLLQQVSGIDFPSFGADLTGPFYQMMMGTDIRPYALNNGILFPPDSEFDYTSVNPLVLGIIIERATGMPYADYLSEALWQKIGAPQAGVVIDSLEHGMARTFCCLQATARSWLHVGLLHLNGGEIGGRRVVPEDWMKAVVTPGELQPNYGYLTWLGNEWQEYRYYNRKTSTRVLHSEAFLADDVIYFDGMGGQRVYIIPSAEIVIVRTGAMAMDWDDARLPNTLLRGLNVSDTQAGAAVSGP